MEVRVVEAVPLPYLLFEYFFSFASVVDPDPQDPHVFGPSGSGTVRQRYGSGSGYFPFLIKMFRGLK